MSEDNWLDQLPEALREAPWLKEAATPEDAVGKLAHAAKLVGTSIRIPDESASDDDRATFYQKLTDVDGVVRMPSYDDPEGINAVLAKLGKPEDHTGYKLPELDNFEWNEQIGEDLRKYAFEAGLTTDQFTRLANQIGSQEKSAGEESTQQMTDAQKALRTDWGDTVEEREELIRGWMDKSSAPESLRELLDTRNLPLDTMNWLHNIAKQFKGEVNPIKKDGSSDTPLMDPSTAIVEIQKVLGELTGMRESDPRYKPMQEKLVMLHKLAKPDQAA